MDRRQISHLRPAVILQLQRLALDHECRPLASSGALAVSHVSSAADRNVVIATVQSCTHEFEPSLFVLSTQGLFSLFFNPAVEAAPQPEEHFNPKNLSVSAETIEHWKEHINPTGDLTQVPGIDEASARLLMAAGITNIDMLAGEYLWLKGPDLGSMDPKVHHEKFFLWLGGGVPGVGIVFHRSTIVHAMGEKARRTFPGIYDPFAWDDDESDDDEPDNDESGDH